LLLSNPMNIGSSLQNCKAVGSILFFIFRFS
jgi:hypothetical protein